MIWIAAGLVVMGVSMVVWAEMRTRRAKRDLAALLKHLKEHDHSDA